MATTGIARAEWIHPRVALLELYWNPTSLVALYVVEGARRALIDTGTPEAASDALASAFERIGRRLADVDVVLNTHSHNDHSGGNRVVKEASPHATVMMHAADVPLLHPLHLFDLQARRTGALGPLDDAASADQATRRRAAATAAPGMRPDATFLDGDRVDLGNGVSLEALHLPGHSPGSTGFYWASEGILFTGDAIAGSASQERFPVIFDARAYRRSQERVQRLPVSLIGTGHRFPYRQPGGDTQNPVRQGTDARRYLADSLTTALDLEASAAEALHTLPGASRREQVAVALERLSVRLNCDVTHLAFAGNAAALWLRELSGAA